MRAQVESGVSLPGTLERERDDYRAIVNHLLNVHASEECLDCKAAAEIVDEYLASRIKQHKSIDFQHDNRLGGRRK